MRNVACAVMAGLLAATAAYGTIAITWTSSWGINDPTIPGDTFDLPVGSLAQLIWSSDNVMNDIDPFNPTVPQGGDSLLTNIWTDTTGIIAPPSGTLTFQDAADEYVPGYVYCRVFNASNPVNGSWYGTAGLVGGPLNDQDPTPGLANTCDVAPDSLFTLGTEIVPEPATWALLGFGALVMAARRRFVK